MPRIGTEVGVHVRKDTFYKAVPVVAIQMVKWRELPNCKRFLCARRMVYKGRMRVVDAIDSRANTSAEPKLGYRLVTYSNPWENQQVNS